MQELGTRNIELMGHYGKTYPVSEGRMEIVANTLVKVQTELSKYADKPELPRKVIGKIRRMKMEAMVQFDHAIPDADYESKEFPISLLADIESFFLINARPV